MLHLFYVARTQKNEENLSIKWSMMNMNRLASSGSENEGNYWKVNDFALSLEIIILGNNLEFS